MDPGVDQFTGARLTNRRPLRRTTTPSPYGELSETQGATLLQQPRRDTVAQRSRGVGIERHTDTQLVNIRLMNANCYSPNASV